MPMEPPLNELVLTVHSYAQVVVVAGVAHRLRWSWVDLRKGRTGPQQHRARARCSARYDHDPVMPVGAFFAIAFLRAVPCLDCWTQTHA